MGLVDSGYVSQGAMTVPFISLRFKPQYYTATNIDRRVAYHQTDDLLLVVLSLDMANNYIGIKKITSLRKKKYNRMFRGSIILICHNLSNKIQFKLFSRIYMRLSH